MYYTLREHLEEAKNTAKDYSDAVWTNLTDDQLDSVVEYGSDHAWNLYTERFVYFPINYDGMLFVGFATRNPDAENLSKPQAGG